MRHLIAAIGILVASWMTATSQTQTIKSHDLSLKGVVVVSSTRGALTLVGKSEGPLKGSFEMSIWYNPVTNAVTGGTWKLTVPRPGRDGASKAQGALAGSIKGGTVTLDEHGRVSSAEGIQINIRTERGPIFPYSERVRKVQRNVQLAPAASVCGPIEHLLLIKVFLTSAGPSTIAFARGGGSVAKETAAVCRLQGFWSNP